MWKFCLKTGLLRSTVADFAYEGPVARIDGDIASPEDKERWEGLSTFVHYGSMDGILVQDAEGRLFRHKGTTGSIREELVRQYDGISARLGFHFYKTAKDARSEAESMSSWGPAYLVYGKVAVFGEVYEGPKGYRAASCQIEHLVIHGGCIGSWVIPHLERTYECDVYTEFPDEWTSESQKGEEKSRRPSPTYNPFASLTWTPQMHPAWLNLGQDDDNQSQPEEEAA